jgi:hypothetical protein
MPGDVMGPLGPSQHQIGGRSRVNQHVGRPLWPEPRLAP